MPQQNLSFISYKEANELDHLLVQKYKIPMKALIEDAGQRIRQWIEDHITIPHLHGVIGKGNNGQDVLSAFLQLKKEFKLSLHLCDESIKKTELFNRLITEKNVSLTQSTPPTNRKTIIIDGIFGTGLSRPIGPSIHQLITQLNQSQHPIISIDVPSGLNENTPSPCIQATTTLAMMLPKKVFLNHEKKETCGTIYLMNFNLKKYDLHPLKFPNTMEAYIKL